MTEQRLLPEDVNSVVLRKGNAQVDLNKAENMTWESPMRNTSSKIPESYGLLKNIRINLQLPVQRCQTCCLTCKLHNAHGFVIKGLHNAVSKMRKDPLASELKKNKKVTKRLVLLSTGK